MQAGFAAGLVVFLISNPKYAEIVGLLRHSSALQVARGRLLQSA
jgi:hypothetical protein